MLRKKIAIIVAAATVAVISLAASASVLAIVVEGGPDQDRSDIEVVRVR